MKYLKIRFAFNALTVPGWNWSEWNHQKIECVRWFSRLRNGIEEQICRIASTLFGGSMARHEIVFKLKLVPRQVKCVFLVRGGMVMVFGNGKKLAEKNERKKKKLNYIYSVWHDTIYINFASLLFATLDNGCQTVGNDFLKPFTASS